jgi:hypothetical protein
MFGYRFLVSRPVLLLQVAGPRFGRVQNRATSKLAQGGHANFDQNMLQSQGESIFAAQHLTFYSRHLRSRITISSINCRADSAQRKQTTIASTPA